jgi:hypothetical protein
MQELRLTSLRENAELSSNPAGDKKPSRIPSLVHPKAVFPMFGSQQPSIIDELKPIIHLDHKIVQLTRHLVFVLVYSPA